MPMTAANARAFLAEEIRVVHNIKSPRLIDALASVPRERFLGPGPWQMYSQAGPRMTDDADPRHVYHYTVFALDPARSLYNGQPSLIATWLDTLGIGRGSHVIHIGCATGYFTALIAHVVGPTGSVHAIEIDPGFVERAKSNLSEWPWVSVRHGNGMTALPASADAVLVHAGATHILDVWLDALAAGGRLLVPLTCLMPGMAATLGKGMTVLITHERERDYRARFLSMVAIYSLQEARDETLANVLGQAMLAGTFARVSRLRRDPHETSDTCWLHGVNCLSAC
jgi:protein-L-isoaspartate(D-aspartate) O-methyltransferase